MAAGGRHGPSLSLILTKAGRALLVAEGESAVPAETPALPASIACDAALPADTTDSDAGPLPPGAEPRPMGPTTGDKDATQPDSPRSGSKQYPVIALLDRDTGTSVADDMAATGWLPHTTPAALTGLRKRGYPVLREQAANGAGSVYRIGSPAAAAA